MAKVVDITSKLKTEEKFLKIGDKTYKVDDSKNAVIQATAKLGDNMAPEQLDEAITILIGEDALKEIEAGGISFSAYQTLFLAIMAVVNEITVEEAEARFRKAR